MSEELKQDHFKVQPKKEDEESPQYSKDVAHSSTPKTVF